ncbi:MAG: hypothetical protein GX060_02225 [Firmicutes bacterium]|nr:hypothetical protein [Bacillota bacterium]
MLDEMTVASHFYRAISQVPAYATCLITCGSQLTELELTAINLRQLEPVPETEQEYIAGLPSFTTYHVWLAGSDIEPLHIGSFDA